MATTKRATVETEDAPRNETPRASGRLGIYGLSKAWEIFFASIESREGEVTPEDESHMATLVHATMDSFDSAGGAVYALEREAQEIRLEAERLMTRAKSRESQAQRIRDLMGRCLDDAGMKSIKGMRFSVTRTAGRPSVKVTDGTLVPAEFYADPKPPEISKTKLAAALANGPVPGAEIVIGAPGLLIR